MSVDLTKCQELQRSNIISRNHNDEHYVISLGPHYDVCWANKRQIRITAAVSAVDVRI